MKGKNILVTVALVLGFGGIIANNRISDAAANKLKDEISNLRSDMEAADASNKAELKAEYTALINQTRDNLKAAYEAADEAILEGLQTLKAELKAAIEESANLAEAADMALANQIAGKIANIVSQIEAISDSISGLEDTHAEDVADLIDVLIDLIDDLGEMETTVGAISDAFAPIETTLNAFSTTLSGLKSTVVALGSSLDALEATLESNYYTISQINGLLGSVNGAIDTLTSLFKVNGTIVSMAQLMEDLDAKFADFSTTIGTLETKADAQAAYDLLQEAIDSINSKLEEFYGEAAKEVKGQLVNKLTAFYISFREDVINVKREQIKTANDGVLPTEYVALFDNIEHLYANDLRAVHEEGISRIILSANVTEATAMEAEFELRMQSVMFKVMFLAEQQIAVANVNDLITTDCPVNFTTAIADAYNAQINAVTFDDSVLLNASAAQSLVYYEGLIQQINDIVMLATGYNTLVKDLKVANAALDSLSVTLTAEQINTFKGYNNSVAAFVNYENAVANATSQDDVNNALAAIEEKFDVVAYGAQTYANAAIAVVAAKTAIAGLTNLLPAHVTSYNTFCDDTLPFDDYNTSFSDILANYTDVAGAKSDIDNILDVNNSDLDVITYAATQYNVLLGEAAIKNTAIDNLENLSSDAKDDFKEDVADAVDFTVFEASLANTLSTYTDLAAAKTALDADINSAKDDLAVVDYGAGTLDAICGACEDADDAIDALTNLEASEKTALKALADAAADYDTFANAYGLVLANYTDVAAAKTALDALKDAAALKFDLVEYGSTEYNDFDGDTNSSNAAIDALTNLSTAEKDVFKSFNTAAGDFTSFLTVLGNIVSTANDATTGKAAIDEAIAGNAAVVSSAVYAANSYDSLKGTAAANKATVDGYEALSQDEKDTLNALSASAIGFGDYNNFLNNLFGATFPGTTTANAAVDVKAAEYKAGLDHVSDLAASYNALVTYRNDTKDGISNAVDYPVLVANGHDVVFNEYLDDYFDLTEVIADTANFSTPAEFGVFVAVRKAEMDNIYAVAAAQNDMEKAAQDAYAALTTTYTADYQVSYLADVLRAAYGEYSVLDGDALKDGVAPELDTVVTTATSNKAALTSDLTDIANGAAQLKSRIDKGLLTKAQMDGYIGTYQSIFFAHCTNGNGDELTVWNNYTAQIAAIESDYAYLYGSNLAAVPTIATGEDYATTKANFDAYVAALEDDNTIQARYVAYTSAINALLPQMNAAFHVLDLQYAAVVAKEAIGDNLDGTTGTLKTAFDAYVTAAGTDVDKVALLNTSYAIYVLELNDAVNTSSAAVENVVAAAILYWSTL